MNKLIKGLLITTLAVSGVANASHTNKTFLMPRPTGVDLPMEYTTYEELIDHKNNKDEIGGRFQITGFFKDSTGGHELGTYFLVNHKHKITIQREDINGHIVSTVQDIDLGYLIHDSEHADEAKNAHLSLHPEIDSYGVRFDYHQNLDKLLKGLYLKANLPVACVETNVKVKAWGEDQFDAGVVADDATTPYIKDILLSYLNGTFANPVETNQSSKLTYALINGRHDATEVADIDITLGYKFLNKSNYYTALAIGLTIPTGNGADGVYMFEPISGNGEHWGLGGDFDAQVRFWKHGEQNLKINVFMKYRYLFENHEHRTLQIKNRPFSQYFLLGERGTQIAKPAANVLMQRVDVTPGSQFDGILGLAYNNGGFVADLGYNLYFREKESVHYKGNFDEMRYQIVSRDWALDTVDFDPTLPNQVDGGGTAATIPLKVSDLDMNAAATPSQLTNAMYSGLGYYFKKWDTPLMLGCGGKYEWASKNSAPDQWTVYAKLGVGF